MAKTSKSSRAQTISKLRDLTEVSKIKLSNVIYEASNNNTVSMNTEEAGKLIRVLNAVLDDCFSSVASTD